jgi:AcrR family transcriptional regulator
MEAQSLRERRRALIEDDILHVARELISEKGYSAMSMDELAARVGISKPTLYGFFRTKADLVIAAAVRDFEQTNALVEEQLRQPGTPLDHLGAILRTVIEYHYRDGSMLLGGSMPEIMELIHGRPETAALKQRMVSLVDTLVMQARAAELIAEDLSDSAIHQIFRGVIMSVLHGDPCYGPVNDPLAHAEDLSQIFVRGVRRQT